MENRPSLYITVGGNVYWWSSDLEGVMSSPLNADGTCNFDPDESVCMEDVQSWIEWRDRDHTPRVVGGTSLFSSYDPDSCPRSNPLALGRCREGRVVDCCKQTEDTDILECPRCGLQWTAPCNFDGDMS